jgi:hypothetical protein
MPGVAAESNNNTMSGGAQKFDNQQQGHGESKNNKRLKNKSIDMYQQNPKNRYVPAIDSSAPYQESQTIRGRGRGGTAYHQDKRLPHRQNEVSRQDYVQPETGAQTESSSFQMQEQGAGTQQGLHGALQQQGGQQAGWSAQQESGFQTHNQYSHRKNTFSSNQGGTYTRNQNQPPTTLQAGAPQRLNGRPQFLGNNNQYRAHSNGTYHGPR